MRRIPKDDPDVFDKDGLWVPFMYRVNVSAWEKLALCVRQRMSIDRHADHIAALENEARRKPTVHRDHVPNFSTSYAIKWGRAQGWRLVEREAYDFRTKRHHDCQFATDAIMRLPIGKLAGIQGAGRSQRADHRRKFDQYGTGPYGSELAKAQGIEIWYLEFDRGSPEPILLERWA